MAKIRVSVRLPAEVVGQLDREAQDCQRDYTKKRDMTGIEERFPENCFLRRLYRVHEKNGGNDNKY